jgi:hypothetical protein
MKVQVNDEQYLGDLIAFLERAGYTVEPVGNRQVLVAPVPRSKRLEVLRLDLELHLRAWEAAHPGVSALRVIDRPDVDPPLGGGNA